MCYNQGESNKLYQKGVKTVTPETVLVMTSDEQIKKELELALTFSGWEVVCAGTRFPEALETALMSRCRAALIYPKELPEQHTELMVSTLSGTSCELILLAAGPEDAVSRDIAARYVKAEVMLPVDDPVETAILLRFFLGAWNSRERMRIELRGRIDELLTMLGFPKKPAGRAVLLEAVYCVVKCRGEGYTLSGTVYPFAAERTGCSPENAGELISDAAAKALSSCPEALIAQVFPGHGDKKITNSVLIPGLAAYLTERFPEYRELPDGVL